MSYDLAFWQGARPRTDAEALATFVEIWDDMEEAEVEVPPTPAIEGLIRELESRWPVDQPSAPWATFPLAADGDGSTLYVNLVLSVSDRHVQAMADVARALGIVCFDPQREALC